MIEENLKDYELSLKSWEKEKERIEKINLERLKKWELEKSRVKQLNDNNEKNWEIEKQNIIELNKKNEEEYLDTIQEIEERFRNKLEIWEKEKSKLERQIEHRIYELKKSYEEANANVIEKYVENVLNIFLVPKIINNLQCQVNYNVSTKMLIIENTFPIIQVELEKRNNKKEYEHFICGLSIIMMYLSYKYDYKNYIDSIAVNGYVDTYNKATGAKISPCILSINVSKNEFDKIDIEHVDSISCFNYLKGIKAPELASLTPIAPLIVIDKSDKRIIEQRNIVGSLNDDLNIAAMDWQDFEHLVSELLEKEFHKNGGEVKVTRASRDGGVDAIAFNPDPIMGGKIVIQAKRYTNMVGVSAVRDLYGTVMNEGATKGILVTTSDYGPDAYEFAKGKPLTLLNGPNLLHLLESHGYHAKIDLNEAKKILVDKNKDVI